MACGCGAHRGRRRRGTRPDRPAASRSTIRPGWCRGWPLRLTSICSPPDPIASAAASTPDACSGVP
jgi:hypothetical protein